MPGDLVVELGLLRFGDWFRSLGGAVMRGGMLRACFCGLREAAGSHGAARQGQGFRGTWHVPGGSLSHGAGDSLTGAPAQEEGTLRGDARFSFKRLLQEALFPGRTHERPTLNPKKL